MGTGASGRRSLSVFRRPYTGCCTHCTANLRIVSAYRFHEFSLFMLAEWRSAGTITITHYHHLIGVTQPHVS
jgi:hypothetical protein